MRHSKAMHLLENGVNLIYIRDLLGHLSIQTTEIYAKASPEMKRKAIEKGSANIIKESHFSEPEKADLLAWLKEIV
jgi:integrase